MEQTKEMVKSEKGKKSRYEVNPVAFDDRMPDIGLQPSGDVYKLKKIETVGEYYVVATFPQVRHTPGGLTIPGADKVLPSAGVVVGASDPDSVMFGKVVKFGTVLPVDLDGYWEIYKNVPLRCVRESNIFVLLPEVPIKWVD